MRPERPIHERTSQGGAAGARLARVSRGAIAVRGLGRLLVPVLVAVGLVCTGPTPLASASVADPERFVCPVRGSARVSEGDAAAVLGVALERSSELVEEVELVATPTVPGYVGIVVGVVGDGERREAAILPMLRCDDSACAGAPLRFRGAARVRVRAVIDLAGYDGDIVVGEGGDLRGPGPRGCPRRPALIVEVIDAPEQGADRLVMIVTMSSPELRVIHSERSHVGPEGGTTVVALRFRGTRGGSPSDLVVLRRRHSARTGEVGIVREDLFNYVDGRYRSAL